MLWDMEYCVDPYSFMEKCAEYHHADCPYEYNRFEKVMVTACPEGFHNDPNDWGLCHPCNQTIDYCNDCYSNNFGVTV